MGGGREATLLTELVSIAASVLGAVACVYFAASMLDPNREERKKKAKYAQALNKRLGRKLTLSSMEMMLTDIVLNPSEIDVCEHDVKGQETLLDELRMKVVYPLLMKDVYCTGLLRQARGVLLYGPPGTGKTMIAKALAKSSGCFFLNVTASSILSKWYGDAQKYVRALWTLADKLQPCIIFIDEVDSFLATRGSQTEHEATLSVKTEFMQWWEGMETMKGSRILVMGATNRPHSLDPAVLRRFSLKYEIGLPDERQRRAIIKAYIQKHIREAAGVVGEIRAPLLDDSLTRSGLSPLTWIAKNTKRYSGSDLHELCAQAAQRPVQEAIKREIRNRLDMEGQFFDLDIQTVRPLELSDFEEALKCVKPGVNGEIVKDGAGVHKGDSPAGPDGSNALGNFIVSTTAAVLEVQRQIEVLKRNQNEGNSRPASASGQYNIRSDESGRREP